MRREALILWTTDLPADTRGTDRTARTAAKETGVPLGFRDMRQRIYLRILSKTGPIVDTRATDREAPVADKTTDTLVDFQDTRRILCTLAR